MSKNLFRGKRIFITGNSGFIGTHLESRLKKLGAVIFGTSSLQNTHIVRGVDIHSYKVVDSLMHGEKIEICIHLAGVTLVEIGREDPYKTFQANIQGTLNILEAARKNKLKRIIVASSVHVYGKNKVPYFENYTPRPSRPYETSKACTDLIAQSYADSFDLPVLIPRFVNIYGPGDLNFTRLIPRTIQSVLNGKSPQMWGGDILRDYLYIDDAIDAYLKLATVGLSKVGNNKVFNFGSDNKSTVENVIKKILQISGKNLPIAKIKEERESEIKSQYVSWSKVKRLLNWQPQTTLDVGLQKTYLWYKNYFS